MENAIPGGGKPPLRVLIVDDHPNTATMLARVLSKLGGTDPIPLEVLTASSGKDALEKMQERGVDILITDFMMPGMNGLELIEKVREGQRPPGQLPHGQKPQGQKPHIILITAYDTPGLAISARRLNVQDYLVKPVQPEKIRAIVSRIIDEMHSTIEVPVAPMKRPFKILVADDYPDNLRLLSTRLQGEGYVLIPAWDGEETLQKIRSELPDLVLLDVNMPKKDGFQVLAEIRADPEIAHIPVIMVTAARIGPRDVREGLSLGADDYVIKPYDWRELAARIQSKLRVKQVEDALRRRMKELGILPEIGQELSSRMNIQELSQVVLTRLAQTLGAEEAALDIFQPDGSAVTYLYTAEKQEIQTHVRPRQAVLNQGAAAYVIASRQGLVIENASGDPRWLSSTLFSNGGGKRSGKGVVSVVVAPLLGHREAIGVLTLIHSEAGYFNIDHQTLLQAVASQAAIAIENAQLFNVEHRRVQELTCLNQINHELLRFSYARELLANLPRLVQAGLGFPEVSVWTIAGNSEDGSDSAALMLAGYAARSESFPEGEGRSVDQAEDAGRELAWQALRQGSLLVVSQDDVVPSVMAVPFRANHNLRGVLMVTDPRPAAFQESERALLEMLATQVSTALERISLFESVEQEQRRLLAVLRSAADAILVLDGEGCLTLANPAGERLFGDAEGLVGCRLSAEDGYEEFLAISERVRLTRQADAGEVRWPDGRTFSVLITPVEEGGQVAVFHDVTHFKALAELKNEYIATATHDLKNPLMAVIGYTDLLSKAGPLTEMQQDFARRIQSAAMQMRDLVLNLLEISRLESGSGMKMGEVDLHSRLAEWVHELTYQARAKNHTIVTELCPEKPILYGDRLLLAQMVHNLLGNAIKYTPPGGRIVVSTRVSEGKLLLQVADNGIGIPDDALPKLFTKFFRVRNESTQDIEGTGLGLAIVKSIVDSHGGEISVTSTLGKGTTFTVALPLMRTVDATTQKSEAIGELAADAQRL